MLTIKQIEFINKKKFVKVALNKNIEAFIVHILSFNSRSKYLIYLVKKIQIVLFFTKKVKILIKYLNFSNIFLEKKVLKLVNITDLNQYTIKLEKISNYFIN